MKIAFVHAPFNHKKFAENLEVVDEEFCVAPPIVLAYVAAIAEKAGHQVMLLDCRVRKLTKKQAFKRLEKFKPELLAFRFDTYNFHQTLCWAKYLKNHLKIPVLAGGINFDLYAKEAMTHKTIDYALRGEVIFSLPLFLKALEKNKDLSKIPGLMYRKEGQVKVNGRLRRLASFDDYPFPARHLLPNRLYSSFLTQKKPYTIMLTTTGCQFNCTFCAIAPLPYRVRSADSVLAEIKECYYQHGIREIDFFDATFFANKKRDLEIFKAIQKAGWKIEWSCRTRVDVVDDEILREASKAGCKRIYIGIESPKKEILKAINKQINIDQIKKAVKLAHKHEIKVMGFFMIGNPGETKQTVLDSVCFAKELDLDFVQFSRTIAKPGSGLDQQLKKTTGIDYWGQFILGKRKEERWPTPWTNLTQKEIERYTKLAYYLFYFRPKPIFRRIKEARSAEEFFRYVRVGSKMLLKYFKHDW